MSNSCMDVIVMLHLSTALVYVKWIVIPKVVSYIGHPCINSRDLWE